MNDRRPFVEPDLALNLVVLLVGLVHLAIAYLMAIVRHVGNPFAAVIYAVITFGWITLAYWLLKRVSHAFVGSSF